MVGGEKGGRCASREPLLMEIEEVEFGGNFLNCVGLGNEIGSRR